jgi:AcrR family transcriptional regulator
MHKYHHGDLKNALIQAGFELVERHGIEQVSLRKIAARVGVSHAAPKHHFPDVSTLSAYIAASGYELLLSKINEHIQKVEQGLLSASKSSSKNADKLFAFGTAYLEFAFTNRNIYDLMTSNEVSRNYNVEDLNINRNRVLGDLQELILSCQAEASVRPGNPESLAIYMWSTVHGFISLTLREQFEAKGVQKPVNELQNEILESLALGLIGQRA